MSAHTGKQVGAAPFDIDEELCELEQLEDEEPWGDADTMREFESGVMRGLR